MIRFGGRPVPGFALGDTDPYIESENNLQTQMQPAIELGDQYISGARQVPGGFPWIIQKAPWAAALDAYEKAANIGMATVATGIDAAGHTDVTKPFTDKAADAGKQVVALANQWVVSSADATHASMLVKSMVNSYTKAIAAGRAAIGIVAPPQQSQQGSQGSQPLPMPSTGGAPGWYVLIPVTIVAAAGGVYLATRKAKAPDGDHLSRR
jgi:hypothetical protein